VEVEKKKEELDLEMQILATLKSNNNPSANYQEKKVAALKARYFDKV
jgi:hypothetical protein